MFTLWELTVLGEIARRLAISVSANPSHNQRMTSISRWVKSKLIELPSAAVGGLTGRS